MTEGTRPKATLERVPISKIRPNKGNIRKDLGDLDGFAAEFDDNPAYPGEPWQPIIVYRDANVYRIADGERRYRAMKKAGKVKECNAYVFDTMEDAVAVLVMLDTDQKRPLDEDERSVGLQTALILGVPEEAVDRRAGEKCAGALRRQIGRQGGKAAQMSIGQLLAADEFADDKEAYEEIMAAGSDQWERKARNIRSRREDARVAAAAEDAAGQAAREHGLQVVDKPPRGATLERTIYTRPDEAIARDAAEWAAVGFVLARPRPTSWGGMTNWEVYSLPPELTPEQEQAAKSKSALRRQAQEGRKRRLEWVARRMVESGANNGLPNVRRFTRDYVLENRMWDVDEFCKKADIDADFFNDSGAYRVPSEYVIAGYWDDMDYLSNAEVDAIGGGNADGSKMVALAASRHVELVSAMRKDGYEPADDEAAFVELCIEAEAGKGRRG